MGLEMQAEPITVSAFYKFVAIAGCPQLQIELRALLEAHAIMGTLLIAPEGINATISGTPANMALVLCHLRSDPRFANLISKDSQAQDHPFQRLKVKIKREIVTLDRPEADPTQMLGTYVAPENWNALMQEPGVTVIDTRNVYEVKTGTFEGATDPGTQSFRQFPDFVTANLDPKKHRKVAMFCTGGIRCEKASSYLLAHGFSQVYHLEGGILKYLETVPPEISLWRGECFVFDERVALEHGVTPGSFAMCKNCGHPVSEVDRATPAFVAGVSCPHCEGRKPTTRA